MQHTIHSHKYLVATLAWLVIVIEYYQKSDGVTGIAGRLNSAETQLSALAMVDLSQYVTATSKVFLAPNTSDQELVDLAKKRIVETGISQDRIQVNYNTQELDAGDLYISYDPPDLVVRIVYEKKPSGMVKMKSAAMIRL